MPALSRIPILTAAGLALVMSGCATHSRSEPALPAALGPAASVEPPSPARVPSITCDIDVTSWSPLRVTVRLRMPPDLVPMRVDANTCASLPYTLVLLSPEGMPYRLHHDIRVTEDPGPTKFLDLLPGKVYTRECYFAQQLTDATDAGRPPLNLSQLPFPRGWCLSGSLQSQDGRTSVMVFGSGVVEK